MMSAYRTIVIKHTLFYFPLYDNRGIRVNWDNTQLSKVTAVDISSFLLGFTDEKCGFVFSFIYLFLLNSGKILQHSKKKHRRNA